MRWINVTSLATSIAANSPHRVFADSPLLSLITAERVREWLQSGPDAADVAKVIAHATQLETQLRTKAYRYGTEIGQIGAIAAVIHANVPNPDRQTDARLCGETAATITTWLTTNGWTADKSAETQAAFGWHEALAAAITNTHFPPDGR